MLKSERSFGSLWVRGIVTCICLTALLTEVASADPALNMQAELSAAGVPGVSVSVSTPAPATPADAAAYASDPTEDRPSLTHANLLSPDPAAPLPLATVVFGSPGSTPLPGILQSPAIESWAAAEDAGFPAWRLAIMAALKHELARGTLLAGVAMQPQFVHRAGANQPDFWATPPDASDLPPGPLSGSLPAAAAEQEIEAGLPVWARSAEVTVENWVAGEQRVSVALRAPTAEFRLINAQDLVVYLAGQQLALNQAGAKIGSVALRIEASPEQPLLTYAGDGSWGQHFMWVSPYLQPYTSGLFEGPVDATSSVDRAADALPLDGATP